MSEEKKKTSRTLSRREFIRDAGIVVGGTAVGSSFILAACKPKEVEVTKTVTSTTTAPGTTSTVTHTTTLPGGTETKTETVTKFVCPVCGEEFDSLAALQAHFNSVHGGGGDAQHVLRKLIVNGDDYWLKIDDNWTLSYVLREKLGFVGLKNGCDRGECGTCAVLLNGKAVFSCMMLAIDVEGQEITTIEGLSSGIDFSPVQQAFIDHNAVQCGFCVPGYIMCATALLKENPQATLQDIKEGLSGHICPCGNVKRMVEAVEMVKGGF